jgi:hypothetical protein
MTIIALPPDVTPTIVCPDWCTIPTEEHLVELPNWEGSVIHTNAERLVAGCRVTLSRLAYADGTPEPDSISGRADMVLIDGHDMNVEDAEAFARAILAAVSEARS